MVVACLALAKPKAEILTRSLFSRYVTVVGSACETFTDFVPLPLQDGATLKNAIIGEDQIEGVHCEGSCTIENVWWAAVCEDALSLKKDGDATGKRCLHILSD